MRSLFSSSKQALALDGSLRYQNQNPPNSNTLRYSLEMHKSRRNADLDYATKHQRNLTQLQAGDDYPSHQSMIKGLDTATKMELLKKGSSLGSSRLESMRASQERIRESVRVSASGNPLDRESFYTH